MPVCHVDGQLCQADIELRAYYFRILAVLLEQAQYRVAQLHTCFSWYLAEVVDDLCKSLSA